MVLSRKRIRPRVQGEQAPELEMRLGQIGRDLDGLPQLAERGGRVTLTGQRERGIDVEAGAVAARGLVLRLERRKCRKQHRPEDEDEDELTPHD